MQRLLHTFLIKLLNKKQDMDKMLLELAFIKNAEKDINKSTAFESLMEVNSF